MDRKHPIAELVSNRASMYSLLARWFRIEVDQELLDQMAKMDFSVEADQPDIAEGYRMLKGFLASVSPDTLTDLAVDYAGAFLGAGKTVGGAAFPYESVYTSLGGLIMQDARDQVLRLYREEGLDRSEELEVPEDHLALELEFMAYLCQKTLESLEAGHDPTVAEYLGKQKTFLHQHLLNWVPSFCADTQQFAQTDFYKAAAKVTHGFLKMEQVLIDGLVEATQTAGA